MTAPALLVVDDEKNTREALYSRLNVIELKAPPLRDCARRPRRKIFINNQIYPKFRLLRKFRDGRFCDLAFGLRRQKNLAHNQNHPKFRLFRNFSAGDSAV
jgi:hypothetical protein